MREKKIQKLALLFLSALTLAGCGIFSKGSQSDQEDFEAGQEAEQAADKLDQAKEKETAKKGFDLDSPSEEFEGLTKKDEIIARSWARAFELGIIRSLSANGPAEIEELEAGTKVNPHSELSPTFPKTVYKIYGGMNMADRVSLDIAINDDGTVSSYDIPLHWQDGEENDRDRAQEIISNPTIMKPEDADPANVKVAVDYLFRGVTSESSGSSSAAASAGTSSSQGQPSAVDWSNFDSIHINANSIYAGVYHSGQVDTLTVERTTPGHGKMTVTKGDFKTGQPTVPDSLDVTITNIQPEGHMATDIQSQDAVSSICTAKIDVVPEQNTHNFPTIYLGEIGDVLVPVEYNKVYWPDNVKMLDSYPNQTGYFRWVASRK